MRRLFAGDKRYSLSGNDDSSITSIFLLVFRIEQAWGDCVETCMATSDLPEWYGSHPTCLPNEDRQWQRSIDSTPRRRK